MQERSTSNAQLLHAKAQRGGAAAAEQLAAADVADASQPRP
eukprot:SAG22_NODE_101_length_20519_cov_15.588002_8_plen_41_part_00